MKVKKIEYISHKGIYPKEVEDAFMPCKWILSKGLKHTAPKAYAKHGIACASPIDKKSVKQVTQGDLVALYGFPGIKLLNKLIGKNVVFITIYQESLVDTYKVLTKAGYTRNDTGSRCIWICSKPIK